MRCNDDININNNDNNNKWKPDLTPFIWVLANINDNINKKK